MKFGFYRWKVLWTEKTKLKVTSMEKLFRSPREALHHSRAFWMSPVCATLVGPLLLSPGRPLNQIRDEKQNHKMRRKRNCVYQFFHVFSKKKLFFIHLTIKWYPFSLFLSQIFFFGCLRGKHKAEESSILSRPKKRITAKSQNFAECEKREMNGEGFNDAWRGVVLCDYICLAMKFVCCQLFDPFEVPVISSGLRTRWVTSSWVNLN